MNDFQNAHFAMNNTLLEMKRDINGKYYPIRDTCRRIFDPKDGCVYTEALYYQTMIESDFVNNITVNLSSGGMNLKSLTTNTSYRFLLCSSNGGKDENCKSECNEVNGEIIKGNHYYK